MSKDPSIPRRNKANWHYIRDDFMFSTIKLVSRHQNTQQFGALFPIELTNENIKKSKAYKEYYAIATGEATPKLKASFRRTRSGSDTSITPPTSIATPRLTAAATPRLTVAAKGKTNSQSTQSQKSIYPLRGDDDEGKDGDDAKEDERDDDEEGEEDDDDDEDKDGDAKDDADEDQEITKHDDKDDTEESGDDDKEERHDEEEEEDELYRGVNINQGRGLQGTLEVKDTHVTLTLVKPDVKVTVQIQLDRLREEAQRDNDEFLRTVDENIKKIIKEQVKEQVKAQVSKILPRIEQAVNEQLEVEVLTKSSHSSRTSYAVAADLSEMELKKILIEKMEGNKSIQRSDEQRNLYKVLVDAYESDKTILDTYGDSVALKRRRDDNEDKDEEPFVGPDRGSKRRGEGKEPGPQKPPSLDRDWNKTLPAIHRSIQPWISKLAKQADTRSSFNELMDTPLDVSNFIMNRLRVDTLTPELLAGPTYDLVKGSCKSVMELEYHLEKVYKATTDQLDWVNPEGQQY
nr:hypothetical protein [Tanacetum cinerariifolium]